MAALTPDQFALVYSDGVCSKTALYALKNVTAGDTVELNNHFKIVKRAGIVSDTGTHIAAVSISSNTVGTIPAGPANDGLWLLVVGVSV